MNSLVVYDSKFGNTERVARAIADALGAFGTARATHVDQVSKDSVAGADLLVVGGPTQAWQATPAIKNFLNGIERRGIAAAAFDTRFHKSAWLTGSAAKGIAKRLRQRGQVLIAPPESFFVEKSEGPLESGELERAAAWARELESRVEAPPAQ